MIQDFLKHFCVTMLGHKLVLICKISAIVIRSYRNSTTDTWREFFRFKIPLFFCVVFKEFFKQIFSNLINYYILGIKYRISFFSDTLKKGSYFLISFKTQIVKFIYSYSINRNRI